MLWGSLTRSSTWWVSRAPDAAWWERDDGGCLQLDEPWLIGANMLTIYRSSALYREIEAGRWREATEVGETEGGEGLVAQLDIPVEFAMLGASTR